jgi:hypothetical protein
MDIDSLTRIIEITPEIRIIQLPPEDKQEAIQSYIPIVVDEVSMANENFDFATDVCDYTGGTVLNQADYTLRGNNNDCRAIINIRYGSDYDLLDEMRPVDLDEYLTDRSHTSTTIWVSHGRVDGFPRIKLVAAPTAAAEAIRYRYFKKNIPLTSFPEEFINVIISGVISKMVPEYKAIHLKDLSDMVNRYSPSGGADNPAKQDPETVRRNNSRFDRQGW